MKENPNFYTHTLANDYVNAIEDEWVNKQFKRVADSKNAAELTGTAEAQDEYEIQDLRLQTEISRLTPPDIQRDLDESDDIIHND